MNIVFIKNWWEQISESEFDSTTESTFNTMVPSLGLCDCFHSQCWQDYFNSCCKCCCICQFTRSFNSAFKGQCCCDENNPESLTPPRSRMLNNNILRKQKIRIKLIFKKP